jgi:hypothetical protein
VTSIVRRTRRARAIPPKPRTARRLGLGEPAQRARPLDAEPTDRSTGLIRPVVTFLGNIAVITALLVYFGWVRSEVQTRLLGFDESVLGMSTQEYLLRSVRSVLLLLGVIAILGLLWIAVDRALFLRLDRRGPSDPVFNLSIKWMPAGLLVLPLAMWLTRGIWPSLAFIAFPLSCGAGLLLFLYAIHLKQRLPGAVPLARGREPLLRLFTFIAVGIALFSAAANYATVEGTALAFSFERAVPNLTGVVIYSADNLHLHAPGIQVDRIGATSEAQVFRYSHLRLLEHTGGNYFLISDAWTRKYGVVLMLADNLPIRLEFVRDLR